jgi:hypothetical protein
MLLSTNSIEMLKTHYMLSFSSSKKGFRMLPNFIIIGAMKGGTTSLYHYIASHPDIVPSSIKETNYFNTIADLCKGLSWYKSLFRNKGKYAFEASTNYTKRHIFPGVPERMYSILPKVKLIYILRDPIERIVSHYIHNYAHGREKSQIFRSYKQWFQQLYQLNMMSQH